MRLLQRIEEVRLAMSEKPDSKLQAGPSSSSPAQAQGSVFSLNDLVKAAQSNAEGKGTPPVEKWHPEFCGEMDLVIRADGSWWHEGTRISRSSLVSLYSTILRKDKDGRHYLVTPVEKIGIQVEKAAFLAARVDIEGIGKDQSLFFTTNVGEVIEAGPSRPIRIETDPETQEPSPFVLVRGRLEAFMRRPVFYELVDAATEIDVEDGKQLGVYSGGMFFPLGPVNSHLI